MTEVPASPSPADPTQPPPQGPRPQAPPDGHSSPGNYVPGDDAPGGYPPPGDHAPGGHVPGGHVPGGYAGSPYQPPYQAPYQPPYRYAPQPPFNTYAILAIIFAVAVLPPLGVYFGNKAKQEIARSGERGIELATAAVVVGWVLSGLMALFLVVWCGFFLTFFGSFLGVLGAASAVGGG